jgi:hypothetical protein
MTPRDIHDRCLIKAAQLSGYQVLNAISPLEVIRVLNQARVAFVLVGSYGLAGWLNKPRATQDVDVVASSRHVKKAVAVLSAAFSQLVPDEQPRMVRLRGRATQDGAIDVLRPATDPLRRVFRHTRNVVSDGQRFRVPSLEMAVAMKFASLVSPDRGYAEKHQDAHDFIGIVKQNADLDGKKLSELASLIYPAGGKDVLEMVRGIRAGEKFNLP